MVQVLNHEILKSIKSKRCVFTITAGRTGTNYLQKLFTLFPDTLSVHEGAPDFVNVLRRAQQNPDIAYSFCLQTKLPFIASVKKNRYVETSHLFCKGFVESFIKCGVIPDIVVLRRPPRQIASSLLKLNTVPARTPYGFMYLLSPEDPNVLPLPQWQYMNDYQLCFWYCLEIERRQKLYTEMFRTLGATVVETQLSELLNFDSFVDIVTRLGFTASVDDEGLKAKFSKLSSTRHNEKFKKTIDASPEQFEQAEKEVWDRIVYYDPLLQSRIAGQYGS
jgi:hypothetical protein